jgi:DNA-binding transcriptional ArsR family regulator
MPSPRSNAQQFRRVLRCFALFGHPMRVVIFQRLAREPRTAGELARQLPVSRVAVVQHIKLLQRAGLLRCRRDGRRRIYSIEPAGLEPLAHWIAAHRAQVAAQADAVVTRR